MAKRIPEIRDVITLNMSQIWRDRRDGASAMAIDRIDGLNSKELRKIFKAARAFGLTITSKRPLIVYGVCTPMGETATFKFVQMDSRQLDNLDDDIYRAAHLR